MYQYKTKHLIITIAMVAALAMALPASSYAATLTAPTCSQADVQNAVNKAKSGDVVKIPSGNCTWDNDIDISGAIRVIGAGIDKTNIRFSSKTAFEHTAVGGTASVYAEYTGFTFYATNADASSSAITLRDANNFRIHHCKFAESRWHPVLSGRRVYQGLIDNNTFNRNKLGSSDYGVSFSGSDTDKPACGLTYTESCLAEWDDWYKKEGDYVGTGGSCAGAPYNVNWKPGQVDAVYIEDNTFNWHGSAIEMNWGSCSKTVWRYNTFNNTNPNSGGIKPGAVYFEMYNNVFNNTSTGETASPNGGMLIRLRADGLFYNNTINGYGGASDYSHIFAFVAYGCSFGYCYPDDVVPNEIYIWNNTYPNSGCTPSDAGCWAEYGEGEPTRIALNENYFFRAPKTGERLFAYMQNESTPLQYTYPHPLQSGLPVPDGGGDAIEAPTNLEVVKPQN